jgi:hypothetical protein
LTSNSDTDGSSRALLARLRSDPVGLLERDVFKIVDAVSSLGSQVRRLANCARSSEPSSESVREGTDRLGPPVRRRPDLRSPTGTLTAGLVVGRGLGELG